MDIDDYEFICPRCGGSFFGRDTAGGEPGEPVRMLSTVRCHATGCGWRGEWPPKRELQQMPPPVTENLRLRIEDEARRQVLTWLESKTYRILMHRHDGCFRAVDQAESKLLDADTVFGMATALADWPKGSQDLQDMGKAREA